MNEDIFNKLPPKTIPIIQRAYEHQTKGWTDNDYKACFYAFTETFGKAIPAKKFDALVHYWGKTLDKGSFNYTKNRRGYTLVPNKMINQKGDDYSTKSFVQESPFRKQYKPKSLAESVGTLHAKMVGENLV